MWSNCLCIAKLIVLTYKNKTPKSKSSTYIHRFGVVKSRILVSMAFDRFAAIREPLHYASILTHSIIGKIGIAVLNSTVCVIFPVTFLIK